MKASRVDAIEQRSTQYRQSHPTIGVETEERIERIDNLGPAQRRLEQRGIDLGNGRGGFVPFRSGGLSSSTEMGEDVGDHAGTVWRYREFALCTRCETSNEGIVPRLWNLFCYAREM